MGVSNDAAVPPSTCSLVCVCELELVSLIAMKVWILLTDTLHAQSMYSRVDSEGVGIL